MYEWNLMFAIINKKPTTVISIFVEKFLAVSLFLRALKRSRLKKSFSFSSFFLLLFFFLGGEGKESY